MTSRTITRIQGLAAVAAGLLFIAIQPIHPPDTLASVTTTTWKVVHLATLVMLTLFVIGIHGVHRTQSERTGWVGSAGFVTLVLGLVVTAAFTFVEAFISPLLAAAAPEFVESLLGMVDGSGGTFDLGDLPGLWAVSGVLFPLGCLLVGVATFRARVLPRWAAAVFAFGLPVTLAVVSLLPWDLHRLGAAPIGIGLAGLGGAVWMGRREQAATEALPAAPVGPALATE